MSPGDTLLVSSPLCLTRRSEQDVDETGQDLSASPYLLTDEDVEELLQQLERAPSKAALDAQEVRCPWEPAKPAGAASNATTTYHMRGFRMPGAGCVAYTSCTAGGGCHILTLSICVCRRG